MATSNTNYQGSSGYTDPALVQPGIVSGSSGVQGGGHGTTGATGVHGTGTGTAGAASSLAPTTTAVGTTTTTSGYGSGSSGAYRGKKVPFAGGAEPRGVDSVGKKLGLAAFSLFLPPAAVAARTGDVCETGLNMGLCMLGYIPGVIHAYIVSFSKARASCMPCGTILEAPGGPDTMVRYPAPRRNSITTTAQLHDRATDVQHGGRRQAASTTTSMPQQQIAVA